MMEPARPRAEEPGDAARGSAGSIVPREMSCEVEGLGMAKACYCFSIGALF